MKWTAGLTTVSTNFRELKFRGRTRRHEFLFRAQLQRSKHANVTDAIGDFKFEAESCIRGYHTYSAVLVATVGECALERRNAKDPFAVAVIERRGVIL